MRPFWRSLAFRITLAFVLLSLLTLGVVGSFAVTYTNRQFASLLQGGAQADTERRVQAYVAAHGSLAGFQDGGPPGQGPPPEEDRQTVPGAAPQFLDQPGRPPFLVLDAGRRVVTGDARHAVGARAEGQNLTPVRLNGAVVAYLLSSGHPPDPDARGAVFLRRTGRAVALVMTAAALLAVLVGVLIARTLLSPLRVLLRAIHAMQGGAEAVPLPRGRGDELGEVLGAFGRLRDDVARHQQARRQLTADIAHDLNTPLFVLSGALEALHNGTFKPSTERFGRLLRQVGQLSGLVRDLRLLSLADAGELPLHRERTDLTGLVQDSVGAFQALTQERGVRLCAALPDKPLEASVDPLRLTQVLHNLLGNAVRHTPAGGQIEVRAAREGAWVTLTVQDSGAGIAPERLPFVLDRLYRGDDARSEGGSGLGLAICKSIVTAHGGRITVESAPGQGTLVRVGLPV